MPPSQPVPRTPSRQLESTLLLAGDVVLGRDGLAGVTVRAVATEAAVAPMGIYSRFGSKDGLVDALLIRTIDSFRVAVASHGEADPLQRLRSSARRYRRWGLDHAKHYEAVFLARTGLGSPDVAERTMLAFGELTAQVEYAIAGGMLWPGDVTETAQEIWCVVHGAVALELHGLVLTPDAEQTFEKLLDTTLRGMSVAPGQVPDL